MTLSKATLYDIISFNFLAIVVLSDVKQITWKKIWIMFHKLWHCCHGNTNRYFFSDMKSNVSYFSLFSLTANFHFLTQCEYWQIGENVELWNRGGKGRNYEITWKQRCYIDIISYILIIESIIHSLWQVHWLHFKGKLVPNLWKNPLRKQWRY